MSEGYFTGIFKIVLACGMCGERKRASERGRKEALPATTRFKLAFLENFEQSPAKLFHNLWVFIACEREDKNRAKLEQIYSYFGWKFFYPSNIYE